MVSEVFLNVCLFAFLDESLKTELKTGNWKTASLGLSDSNKINYEHL